MTGNRHPIDRPVFLIGMGRSGTTLVFESLARTCEAGWFPNHLDHFPSCTPLAFVTRLCDFSDAFRKQVTPSGGPKRLMERLRIGPAEAWGVWRRTCGSRFLFDYLLGETATEAERRETRSLVLQLLRWEGKRRFVAKFTGPARLGYLLSIFPDARFVHIVRDGRSVVDSLLRAEFWSRSFRMYEPAWQGGLTKSDYRIWNESSRQPAVLAALQWRRVIERAWEERDRYRPEAFVELRYEDFAARPLDALGPVLEATELSLTPRARRWLRDRAGIRSVQRVPGARLEEPLREQVELILSDVLRHYGYLTDRRGGRVRSVGDGTSRV